MRIPLAFLTLRYVTITGFPATSRIFWCAGFFMGLIVTEKTSFGFLWRCEYTTPMPVKIPSKNTARTIDTFALKSTAYIGSPASLVVHTLFFIGIFLLSIFGVEFEQILLILTTLVSLEAIYLAIFIQI